MIGIEPGLTDSGGCLAILPNIKWTLTFGDLVAAVVPILAFFGGMYYKQYFWNKEKFDDEYNEFLSNLYKIHFSLRVRDIPRLGGLDGLISQTPHKFESNLRSDWKKVRETINELKENTNTMLFSQARQYNYSDEEKEKPLREIKWLENKVEHFYMNHLPGRLKYRITAIPGIVKGWFD